MRCMVWVFLFFLCVGACGGIMPGAGRQSCRCFAHVIASSGAWFIAGARFFFLECGAVGARETRGGCRACVVVWRWRGFCCARAGPSGAHRGRALGVAGPDRCGGGLCGHGAGRRGERGGRAKSVRGPPKSVRPPFGASWKSVRLSSKTRVTGAPAPILWSCPWIGSARLSVLRLSVPRVFDTQRY